MQDELTGDCARCARAFPKLDLIHMGGHYLCNRCYRKERGWFSLLILDMVSRWLEKRGLMIASQFTYDRLLRDSHDLTMAMESVTRLQAQVETIQARIELITHMQGFSDQHGMTLVSDQKVVGEWLDTMIEQQGGHDGSK